MTVDGGDAIGGPGKLDIAPPLDGIDQDPAADSTTELSTSSVSEPICAESGDEIDTAQKSADSGGPRPKTLAKRRQTSKKPVAKPQTIVELVQYVYRETGAGRKVNLARNLWELRAAPESAQREIDQVRELARKDPFLDALANLMVEVADIELKDSVRRRILQLAEVAFASHELFAGQVERLAEPNVEPRLTATEISHAAGTIRLAELDKEESLALSGAKRERLRVNAVTSFELFRVMRDHWSKEQFIEDFCQLVWRVPSRFQASERSDRVGATRIHSLSADEASARERADWRTVAMLAKSRSANEPLSELKRYFDALIRDREKNIDDLVEEVATQRRRADRERATAQSLAAELERKNSQVVGLESRVAELESQLEKEQRGRFADEVNAVDDYENLRTQVIRQLTGQVNLLQDGLHALRNGSILVADEFVDRALVKIDAELARLKELAQ